MDRLFFAIGAIAALLSVAIGAFGAHALEGQLDARAFRSYETAARYQMYHAIGLLFVSWASTRFPSVAVRVAGWSFVVGLVLFCGSLYALAFGSPRAFGAVAPIGGVSFMVGWASLAAAALLAGT